MPVRVRLRADPPHFWWRTAGSRGVSEVPVFLA